jgi:hypothetical protein
MLDDLAIGDPAQAHPVGLKLFLSFLPVTGDEVFMIRYPAGTPDAHDAIAVCEHTLDGKFQIGVLFSIEFHIGLHDLESSQ